MRAATNSPVSDSPEAIAAPPRQPHTGAGGPSSVWRRNRWLLGVLVLTLVIAELPHLLAACCAPSGATGFGTAWFVNDFAQYESAMRQGAEQAGWLVHDPFTAEPHPDTFMFPLYVAMGKLAATLHLPAIWLEQLAEVVSRALLVLALWRFCRAFARGRIAARWAFGLTLFASGFEVFSAMLGGYTGNWSYEMNGFGLLFAAPHVPLAMAATLELARDLLRPHPGIRLPRLIKVGALSAAIALVHPFHAPALLGAIGLAALAFWPSERGAAHLVGAVIAGAAAVPVLAPTVATFSFQPFWQATYSSQNVLPSPAPHELIVDLGVPLLLALAGVVLFRGRVAPFGLLLWLLLALIAMYLPVPYQRRLSFGLQPAVAVLAANTLVGLPGLIGERRAHVVRLATVAAAGLGTAVVLLSVIASTFNNTPLPVYRSTRDLDTAAAWLNETATSREVILADWQTANYLAARTPARVFGGHPVATLHPDQKQFQIATVFAHPSSLLVARELNVQWLVYGPAEATLTGPNATPAFQVGAVRVYRVA